MRFLYHLSNFPAAYSHHCRRDLKPADFLVNLYNANTESEQLSTLSDLSNVLRKINDISNKNVVLGGDFNLPFKAKLGPQGGNPGLKKNSLAKII